MSFEGQTYSTVDSAGLWLMERGGGSKADRRLTAECGCLIGVVSHVERLCGGGTVSGTLVLALSSQAVRLKETEKNKGSVTTLQRRRFEFPAWGRKLSVIHGKVKISQREMIPVRSILISDFTSQFLRGETIQHLTTKITLFVHLFVVDLFFQYFLSWLSSCCP